MRLKKTIKSLDEVGQEWRGLYKKVGDSFVLQKIETEDEGDGDATEDDDTEDKAESAKDKKIREMRTNNIKLLKRLEDMEKKFSGVDLDLYHAGREAIENARTQEEKELLSKGKFNEVLERQKRTLTENFQKEMLKLQEQNKAATSQLAAMREDVRYTKIESSLLREAEKSKVRFAAGARPDVLARAFAVMDIDEDGSIVAFDGEGEEREYKLTKENKKFGIPDFFQQLAEEAPHLLEGATGGDVNNGGRKNGGTRFGVLKIDRNDVKGFGNNLDAIAKGKVQVQM